MRDIDITDITIVCTLFIVTHAALYGTPCSYLREECKMLSPYLSICARLRNRERGEGENQREREREREREGEI